MQKYEKILIVLGQEYPELLNKWKTYCEWQGWNIDAVPVNMLRLWLEKRHEDFAVLFDKK